MQPAYRIVGQRGGRLFPNSKPRYYPTTKAEEANWFFLAPAVANDKVASGNQQNLIRLGCEANQPCPREGWWFTPAKADSRRQFKQGEIMPEFTSSTWGRTIWYWGEYQD